MPTFRGFNVNAETAGLWRRGEGTTMEEGSYEARKSASKERIDITMRTERGRRWTAEEKLRIIRGTLRPGAVAQLAANQHGIVRQASVHVTQADADRGDDRVRRSRSGSGR